MAGAALVADAATLQLAERGRSGVDGVLDLALGGAAAELQLDVDLSERTLIALDNGNEVARYAVAVGTKQYPTPRGSFRIRKVVWNPPWKPPDSPWAKGKDAKPPGHPDNPMKRVKIFFSEPDYYIHGTDEDDSLGRAESHGCFRLANWDALTLLNLVQVGLPVMVEP